MKFRLERLFSDRAFRDMWTDQEVLQWLSTTCILCGQSYAPGLLCRHLHEAHTTGHQFVDFYNESLLPTFLKALTTDYKCDLCNQIFNLPPAPDTAADLPSRTKLVQDHLQGNCPILLQSSLLLGTALNGGRLGYEWIGRQRTGANQGDLPVPAADAGSDAEAGTKPEDTKTTSHRGSAARTSRSRSCRNQQPSRRATMPSSDGATDLASRAQSELAAKYRLFHTVLPTGQGGHVAGIGQGNSDMADVETTESRSPTTAIATAPVPLVAEGAPDQSPEGFRMQSGRPHTASVPGEEADSGRHELALPSMGSQPEGPCDRPEEGSHNAEDAAALGGTHRGLPGLNAGGTISRAADEQCASSSAMETATQYEDGSPPRAPGCPDSFFDMAAGRDNTETAFHQEQPSGGHPAPADDSDKGSWQGREVSGQAQRLLNSADLQNLRSLATRLALDNDSTWCYANATVHCLIWTLLSLSDAEEISWGQHCKSLHKMLFDSQNHTVKLVELEWFQQLLAFWGRSQDQQDCGEFTHTMLQWLDSPAINMSWERRCEMEEQVRCQDTGASTMPLLLQFPIEIATKPQCRLDQLVSFWCQAYGMQAALLSAAPIVCVHIDRMFENESGQIEKSGCVINLDSETILPIFCDASLKHDFATYVLIAAATHLGVDRAGHYQALLKVQPTVTDGVRPIQWLLTQDNQRPEPIWRVPLLFLQNMTVAWLMRSDCISLPLYTEAPLAASPDFAKDPEQQILELLQSTTAALNPKMAPSGAMQ